MARGMSCVAALCALLPACAASSEAGETSNARLLAEIKALEAELAAVEESIAVAEQSAVIRERTARMMAGEAAEEGALADKTPPPIGRPEVRPPTAQAPLGRNNPPLRLPRASDAPFLREWLVSGPYPNYLADDGSTLGLRTDFLAGIGGERAAMPREGDAMSVEFIADKSKLIAGLGSANEWGRTETFTVDASWRRVEFVDGLVDTEHLFPEVRDYFAFYALCYFESDAERDAAVLVGADDFHAVWLNDMELGRAETSQTVRPGDFAYRAHIRKGLNKLLVKIVDVAGGSGFCVQLCGADGAPLAGLAIRNDVARSELDALAAALHPSRPEGEVEKEAAGLESQRQDLERRLAEAKSALEAVSVRADAARERMRESFDEAERMLARRRESNLVGAKRSIDEPLPRRESRRRLCINGIWRGSRDGGATWSPIHLPNMFCDAGKLWLNYPVDRRGRNLQGWEDWSLSPLLVESQKPVIYKSSFQWDGTGAAELVCEAILGKASFRCNGAYCGDYDGIVGEVRVPLPGLRQGENELEIELRPARRYVKFGNQSGIPGDIYVEYRPEARVEDVAVRTSWEKASISVSVEVVNAGAAAGRFTLRPMVVENGRVRLELPESTLDVRPGETGFAETAAKWADPKLWGIGGKYGDPNLYELVTELFLDGKFIDRHRETFGFREFRILGTEFFLNGRRIVLQGDVGSAKFELRRVRDIVWNLLREDGVNIIRTHGNAFWSVPLVRDADKSGMLVYAQMYPIWRGTGPNWENRVPFEEWRETDEHRWNLENYRRWWKAMRNHPSVVIWSTDNEIFTQAWDKPAEAEYNVRSDKIGALYSAFMKELDPDIVVTRDGDLGTLNHQQRCFDDPPCDTANYHYPDFHPAKTIVNWRGRYEYRPVIWGEILYGSYGAWDGWIGPVPSQVAKKAKKVRRIASLLKEEDSPCQIFMGLGMDCYAVADESGKGNPWGMKESERVAYTNDGALPCGMGVREYPWFELKWPSRSGSGPRHTAMRMDAWCNTVWIVNCYDPTRPVAVRNAVAEAYREILHPQPPLRAGQYAEAMVEGAGAGADVWAVAPDGGVSGVRADADGRAWFRDLGDGEYVFTTTNGETTATLRRRGTAALAPGFGDIATIKMAARVKAGAVAPVSFAPMFGDHAVLQRDCALPLWGAAAPNAEVLVALLDSGGVQVATATATSDANGKWSAVLPPHPAGGPFSLRAVCLPGAPAISRDILFGDVWFCSGQSNMDMNYMWGLTRGKEDIEETDDPLMRLFDDHDAVSDEPLANLARQAAWTGSGFSHAKTFSACAWFFGQALRKAMPDVPIGLIEASWSGSPIRTWISREAYRSIGRAQAAECEAAAARIAAFRAAGGRDGFEKRHSAWKADCLAKGDIRADADDFDDSSWETVSLPAAMERHLGKDFDGRVWYRRGFTVSAVQAAGAATLSLGRIDDEDETWVNGVKVGSSKRHDKRRQYAVPPGILKEGRNVIAVEATDWKMDGGFVSDDPNELGLRFADGSSIALAGEWRCAAFEFAPEPRDEDVDFQTPAACWNAMLHPLFPMAIKGAIWYQGCADVYRGAPIYGKKFWAMAEEWRSRFTHPDGLPIYLVQLASWRETHEKPVESQRAAMRWMQMTLGESVPGCGTAVAIDTGDHKDIHPKDKKTIGERLARLAIVRTYGAKGIVESGPIPQGAAVDGDDVVLTFRNAAGLAAKDGGPLKGFQLVGADGKAAWADAEIDGETVRVAVPTGSVPAKVRHAWDDYPACNLVNGNGLPCGSFEMPVVFP